MKTDEVKPKKLFFQSDFGNEIYNSLVRNTGVGIKMQEINISFPSKYEDYPNLIDTDDEEIQFLIQVLQDLEPWKDRKSIPENLPVKISGEQFSLILKEVENN